MVTFSTMNLFEAIKNYDIDAFGKDKRVRQTLIFWTVVWLFLGVLIVNSLLNQARVSVNWNEAMLAGVFIWGISATVLFWLTGIIGSYFIYPLVKD